MDHRTLLIVSDDQDLVRHISELAPDFALQVQHAPDGVSALYQASRQPPSAVLVDDNLAGMDAYELINKFAQQPPLKNVARLLLVSRSTARGFLDEDMDPHEVLFAPMAPRNILQQVHTLLGIRQVVAQWIDTTRNLELENERLRIELERRRLDQQEGTATSPLFDKITLLPTLPLCMEELAQRLERGEQIDLILTDVGRYYRMEEMHGWQFIDTVMGRIANTISDFCELHISDEVIPAVTRPGGGGFLLFLCRPTTGDSPDPDAVTSRRVQIEQTIGQLHSHLTQALTQEFGRGYARYFTFHFGHIPIVHLPQVRLERTIYEAIDQAKHRAIRHSEQDVRRKVRELEQIIDRGTIRTVLHPIIRLDTMHLFAVEALSRGPKGSIFENPQVLFEMASIADKIWALDQVCVRRSVEHFVSQGLEATLFLNLDPVSLAHPNFRNLSFLEAYENFAANLVIEITERAAINDLGLFRELCSFLRRVGIRIALDDVGSGYASFEAIAELEPDFLKIDKSLVRGIDNNVIKHNLVKSLVAFAKKVGIQIIAEGIETPEELEVVRATGAHYGQGHLFSHPSETVNVDFEALLERLETRGVPATRTRSAPVSGPDV